MRTTALSIALLTAGTVQAQTQTQTQVYRCADPATGRAVYSQTRCGPVADPLDLHVHTPSEQQRQQARERTAEAEQIVEAIRQERAMQRAHQREAHSYAEQQRQLQAEHQSVEPGGYRAGRAGKSRSGSGRYDFVRPGPPRVGPLPPPPPPPQSSAASQGRPMPGWEPPPPRPPR